MTENYCNLFQFQAGDAPVPSKAKNIPIGEVTQNISKIKLFQVSMCSILRVYM